MNSIQMLYAHGRVTNNADRRYTMSLNNMAMELVVNSAMICLFAEVVVHNSSFRQIIFYPAFNACYRISD
jgi:hypothetical protein